MEERLKRAKPVPTSQNKTYFAFDLGAVTTSIRLSGGPSLLSQLLPAVQAIRLTEEAGYPLRCSAVKSTKTTSASRSPGRRIGTRPFRPATY